MYRSASASGILDKITFIQNGVDEVRRSAVISVDNSNNGGSSVRLPNTTIVGNNTTEQSLETVLLSDLINAIKIVEKPSLIVIKIDVELLECRTFLGSSSIFKRPQDVPIDAVIMEWVFIRENGEYSEQCPMEKVKLMTKMFLDGGYIPYRANDTRELNTANLGLEWKTDVLWRLQKNSSLAQ